MIKRYSGAAFAEVASRRRFNGSSWVDLTFGRRFDGSAWVDLWSGSQGGGSDDSSASSKSGSLVSDTVSTASSPHVHYAAAYSATKNGSALSVDLTFTAWLNSSGSSLKTGIKLTVFARINGGEWASVVIKQNSAVWTGTSRHSASLHLAAVAGGSSVKVDFYVTRNGSSYGGDAGKLGTASQPKSYQFTMN